MSNAVVTIKRGEGFVRIVGSRVGRISLRIVLQEDAGAVNVTALRLANDFDADTNQSATLVVNGIILTNRRLVLASN